MNTTLVTPLARRLTARESYRGQPVAVMIKGTVKTVVGTVSTWDRRSLVLLVNGRKQLLSVGLAEVYAA